MNTKAIKACADHTAERPRNRRGIKTLNKSATEERNSYCTDTRLAQLGAASNDNGTASNPMDSRHFDDVAWPIGLILIAAAYSSCLLQLA